MSKFYEVPANYLKLLHEELQGIKEFELSAEIINPYLDELNAILKRYTDNSNVLYADDEGRFLQYLHLSAERLRTGEMLVWRNFGQGALLTLTRSETLLRRIWVCLLTLKCGGMQKTSLGNRFESKTERGRTQSANAGEISTRRASHMWFISTIEVQAQSVT